MKTPGQVAYETYRADYAVVVNWQDLHFGERNAWERAANAVLQAAANGEIEIPHIEVEPDPSPQRALAWTSCPQRDFVTGVCSFCGTTHGRVG